MNSNKLSQKYLLNIKFFMFIKIYALKPIRFGPKHGSFIKNQFAKISSEYSRDDNCNAFETHRPLSTYEKSCIFL